MQQYYDEEISHSTIMNHTSGSLVRTKNNVGADYKVIRLIIVISDHPNFTLSTILLKYQLSTC